MYTTSNYSPIQAPPHYRSMARVNFAHALGKLHELMRDIDPTGCDESYAAFIIEAVEYYYLPHTLKSCSFGEFDYALECFKVPSDVRAYYCEALASACRLDLKEQLHSRERRYAPNIVRPATTGEGWFILEW